MYYTGDPQAVSIPGSELLRVRRSVHEKHSSLVCDVPTLVSSEPDFRPVAVFSQLLGIAFEIFVADNDSVSLHPIVFGDKSSAAITLVGYVLNNRIRYAIVLSDVSGQRSISPFEFSEFLRAAVESIVTDDIRTFLLSTDNFGRASLAFYRNVSSDVIIAHSLQIRDQEKLREIFRLTRRRTMLVTLLVGPFQLLIVASLIITLGRSMTHTCLLTRFLVAVAAIVVQLLTISIASFVVWRQWYCDKPLWV